LTASLANGLPGLAFGFGGDSAGVDDNGIVEVQFVTVTAHDLGFVSVQPTAEGNNLRSASWVMV
jgi:hypothetical protein